MTDVVRMTSLAPTFKTIGNTPGFVADPAFEWSSFASSTATSTHTYTYAYAYAATNYANPHAVTSIGTGSATTTYAYDTNGNLVAATLGATTTAYLWDYTNRMNEIGTTGGATTTFSYDHAGARVLKGTGTATTTYATKYFEIQGATSTAYLFLPDGTLVATIEGGPSATTTSYMHGDHLGSTNVVTDEDGGLIQTLDYYPFGSKRIDSGAQATDRQFIGQRYDASTALQYLNARYMDSARGQFLSQDPMFWLLPDVLLSDPQQMNAYNYGRNNPLTYKDPFGLYNLKSGKVEKGDTLSLIRNLINKTNGTNYSVSQLANLNKISNPDRIYVGQTIKPNNSVPDVTRALNNVNKASGSEAKRTSVFSPNTSGEVKTMGAVQFASKFRPGGSEDLKAQGQNTEGGIFCQQNSCGGQRAESYIFNAEEIPGDAPGNIHYGYVGKEAGYSLNTLLFFGGVVHTISHPGQFGDPLSDKGFVTQGYGLSY